MLIFNPEGLRYEVEECINYLKENQTGDSGIELDFYDLTAEDFNEDLYAEAIDEDYTIPMKLDNSDEVNITIRELIELVEESKNVLLHDKSMCISNKTALVRISECERDDFTVANELLCNYDEIFNTEAIINNKSVSICIIKEFSLFALMNHFKGFYGGYFESFTNLDKFIKLRFDEQLTKEEVMEVVYSYLFELSASHDLNYMLEDFYFEENFEEPTVEISEQYELRPLMFGQGLNDLLKIFNQAIRSVNNEEYAIIQYTKVLEFVSQTVIRQEINNKAMTKLYSKKALDPDANYIRELERLFLDLKKKYETDRDAVRATIETCCDLNEIKDLAPKYIKKLNNLNNYNPNADKEGIMVAVYEELSNAISDTRNYLSHAKSNYILKGKECPQEQLEQFAEMMHILAIQAIRWFGKTHEDSRVL